MRLILIFLLITSATSSIVMAQENGLKKEEIQFVKQLISTFKTKNKSKIADLISYPIRREYPLKYVNDKTDFIKRFDEIIDKKLIDNIINSKITDWSALGWRGIMLDDGIIWIDYDGKIIAFNYQSPREKQLLAQAIMDDKKQLPKSMQDFEKPGYLILTKNYKIRIDEKKPGIYRYAAWKIKNQAIEPDIIIENGRLEFGGSGGNHVITFMNNGYTYLVYINEIGESSTPEASLVVSKSEKNILTEEGVIKRD